MTNSDDNFERVSRYVKKIANSELDREKRFRAIDQLRDFIRRKGIWDIFCVRARSYSHFQKIRDFFGEVYRASF